MVALRAGVRSGNTTLMNFRRREEFRAVHLPDLTPPRTLTRFVLDRPVGVLEGTAARFPVEKYPGVGGPGGGTQLIFPKNIRVPRG